MREKLKGVFTGAFTLALFAYLLLFPKETANAVRTGFDFCARVIVPQLFASTVLSKLIIRLPLLSFAAKRFGNRGYDVAVLLIGSLCGFPSGALCAYELYEADAISKKRAEAMCAFSGNVSASFLIGYVGETLMGNARYGVYILLLQLAMSFLFMLFLSPRNEKAAITHAAVKVPLTDSVVSSAMTLIGVCALIMFFSFISGIFRVLPFIPDGAKVYITGFFEFASGCSAAGSNLKLLGLICGFSGVCVFCQAASVTRGRLSLKLFALCRVISGAVMYFVLPQA